MTVILFVLMIIIFLGADFVVQRNIKQVPVVYRTQRADDPVRVPSGVFFAPSHTWLTLYPSGNVRLGIDDFVLRMTKNPKLVLLKRAGAAVKRGEPLIEIRDETCAVTARSPIDADVVELNNAIQGNQPSLRKTLFSDGWAYTIKPKRISDLTGLLLGDQSQAWIQHEFGRLRDFIAGVSPDESPVPVLMQDGGVPAEGIFKNFTDEQAAKFEQEFLSVE
jgi:glycine cleavage system H lipoate-binding protein